MSSRPGARPSGAAALALRRRRTAGGASSSGAANSSSSASLSSQTGAGSGSMLPFYTEDAPGLQIGPTVVLMSSLLFIMFVVLLHVWGKFTR